MSQRTRSRLASAILAAGLVAGLGIGSPTATAEPPVPPPAPAFPDPFAPPPAAEPDPFAPVGGPGAQPLPIPEGTPAGQNPNPFIGLPPFVPPSFNPVNGSIAGAAKPIYINFQRPIANRQMAQDAVHITSNPPVPGRFYWVTDTQLRWRPQDFWPKGAVVSIDAAGTKSTFTVPEQLVATIDDTTKTMTVVRNGEVEKEFPVSMGKAGNDTKNGTYYVLEKFADMVMDSSTYGVPVDAAEGYKLEVKDAVRINNAGIFVHGAPWSVADQGKRNVSHGCPNLSPANAQWFYDNFGSGDPVVVKNSVGIYDENDGAQDWQI